MTYTIPISNNVIPTRLKVLQGAKLHLDTYPRWFGLLASPGKRVITVGMSIPMMITK